MANRHFQMPARVNKGPFRIYDLGGGGGFDPDSQSKTNTPLLKTTP